MIGESMLITRSVQRRPHKWVTFAASLFIHSFFIAALIITPLMDADAGMPTLTIEQIFLGTPTPPAPPPPAVGGPKNPTGNGTDTTVRPTPDKPKEVKDDTLYTPTVIKDEIPPEKLNIDLGPSSPTGLGPIDGVVSFSELGVSSDDLKPLFNPNPTDPTPPGRLVSLITPPKLIRNPPPVYPEIALRSRITGTVTIQAETDVYGKVVTMKIVRGKPFLNEAALEAVQKWLYEPYIVNGIPRPVSFIVEVHFRLSN